MTFKSNTNLIININRELFTSSMEVSTNGYIKVGPDGFQGTVAGYTSGGDLRFNVIDKFPFASDSNASDVGDLPTSKYGAAGQSSTVAGYNSAGDTSPGATIHKVVFASGSISTVGSLTVSRTNSGTGHSSPASGYTSGGGGGVVPTVNVIDKFPFAVDTNTTDVGDLSIITIHASGQSSEIFGFSSGGLSPPNFSISTNVIDRFHFASSANASDIGDIITSRAYAAGQSSEVSGYVSGGNPTGINVIEKFPFAVFANTIDVGDLVDNRFGPAGQSSTVSGYTSGGFSPGPSNTIDKFPFATDTNASNVGDLTVGSRYSTGHQD